MKGFQGHILCVVLWCFLKVVIGDNSNDSVRMLNAEHHGGAFVKMLEERFPLAPKADHQLVAILKDRGFKPVTELSGKSHADYYYPSVDVIRQTLYKFEGIIPNKQLTPTTDLYDMDLSTFPCLVPIAPSNAVRNYVSLKSMIEARLGRAPYSLLEVGSFVGAGATGSWSKIVAENGTVLCLDTWEGDLNMRLGKDFQPFMRMKNGFPQLFKNFMSCVKDNHLENKIFPITVTSFLGARMLGLFQWKFDVIYVDSAHELGETLVEIILFWQLLPPGGLLMGDDYEAFPAVKQDVSLFANAKDLKVEVFADGQQWLIQKPMRAP